MSFSCSYLGVPDAVKQALHNHSEQLNGQSKEELEAILPALDSLLDQNVGSGIVHLSANGHATIVDGKRTYGSCQIELRVIGQLTELRT